MRMDRDQTIRIILTILYICQILNLTHRFTFIICHPFLTLGHDGCTIN